MGQSWRMAGWNLLIAVLPGRWCCLRRQGGVRMMVRAVSAGCGDLSRGSVVETGRAADVVWVRGRQVRLVSPRPDEIGAGLERLVLHFDPAMVLLGRRPLLPTN